MLQVLGIFSCYEVDGSYYIFGDTKVCCATFRVFMLFPADRKSASLTAGGFMRASWAAQGVHGSLDDGTDFGMANRLIMTFGMIGLTYLLLTKNKTNIQTCDVRTTRKYAFIFADYSDRWSLILCMVFH